MRVALFVTCVTDTLFPQTGVATVRVLERAGCEVAFPREQTCCGQLHANSGYQLEAVPLVRRFVATFGDPSFDAIAWRPPARAWRWCATSTRGSPSWPATKSWRRRSRR